jgi:hypothetical protein
LEQAVRTLLIITGGKETPTRATHTRIVPAVEIVLQSGRLGQAVRTLLIITGGKETPTRAAHTRIVPPVEIILQTGRLIQQPARVRKGQVHVLRVALTHRVAVAVLVGAIVCLIDNIPERVVCPVQVLT